MSESDEINWREVEKEILSNMQKNKFKYSAYKQSDEKFEKEVSRLILMLLSRRNKESVSEAIHFSANYILAKEYIYTIRYDDKAEMWIYRDGIYVPEGRTYIKELLVKMLQQAYTSNFGNRVIDIVEAKTYIEPKDFFEVKNIEIIAVQNGLLNVVTQEISNFNPREIYFNKIPVYYDETKDCPEIKKFLRSVVKYESDIDILQELAGYLLYKQYKFEKAFMFSGTGRNGKGKTIELFKRLIGAENTVNIPLQKLEDEFYVSELHNKLANLGADINSQSLRDTGLFKGLTGRDMVSANRKFKNHIHFENYAKMIFCANELPRTDDISDAFFMRWIIIEFPYVFVPKSEMSGKKNEKEQDPDIIDKITTEDELSGMLNWALVGLHRLLDNKSFTDSKSVNEIRMQWIRKSDSLRSFCMDCIVEDFEGKIEKKEFLYNYVQYCKENKIRAVSDKIIKSVLQMDYGVVDDQIEIAGKKSRYWLGISWNENFKKYDKNDEDKNLISNVKFNNKDNRENYNFSEKNNFSNNEEYVVNVGNDGNEYNKMYIGFDKSNQQQGEHSNLTYIEKMKFHIRSKNYVHLVDPDFNKNLKNDFTADFKKTQREEQGENCLLDFKKSEDGEACQIFLKIDKNNPEHLIKFFEQFEIAYNTNLVPVEKLYDMFSDDLIKKMLREGVIFEPQRNFFALLR